MLCECDHDLDYAHDCYCHGHSHGHGHGVFILATSSLHTSKRQIKLSPGQMLLFYSTLQNFENHIHLLDVSKRSRSEYFHSTTCIVMHVMRRSIIFCSFIIFMHILIQMYASILKQWRIPGPKVSQKGNIKQCLFQHVTMKNCCHETLVSETWSANRIQM